MILTEKLPKYQLCHQAKLISMNILLVKICYHLNNKKKQIKTTEDLGERQIKAIQNQGEIKTIKFYPYSDKDSPLISKQKEIFNKLVDKRTDEITILNKKVNPDDLIYRYKGFNADAKFNEFDNAFSLLDKIRDGKVSLANAKIDQAEFKSNLSKIKKETKNIDQKSKKYLV